MNETKYKLICKIKEKTIVISINYLVNLPMHQLEEILNKLTNKTNYQGGKSD